MPEIILVHCSKLLLARRACEAISLFLVSFLKRQIKGFSPRIEQDVEASLAATINWPGNRRSLVTTGAVPFFLLIITAVVRRDGNTGEDLPRGSGRWIPQARCDK